MSSCLTCPSSCATTDASSLRSAPSNQVVVEHHALGLADPVDVRVQGGHPPARVHPVDVADVHAGAATDLQGPPRRAGLPFGRASKWLKSGAMTTGASQVMAAPMATAVTAPGIHQRAAKPPDERDHDRAAGRRREHPDARRLRQVREPRVERLRGEAVVDGVLVAGDPEGDARDGQRERDAPPLQPRRPRAAGPRSARAPGRPRGGARSRARRAPPAPPSASR